ncbi:MAG: PEP-CTERM sorting domain-containing protein, partial [Bryobacteraceae bacterium]
TLSFTDPTDTLTFTGAIKYDTSSDPWFTYSGSPQTLGAYTVDFDTSTTGWYNSCSALGASSCYSLANKSVVITGILTGPTSSVPEPASAGMMLLAALGLLAFGWKRKLFASKQ